MGAGGPRTDEDDDSWLRESQALGDAFEKLFGKTFAAKVSGSNTGFREQALLPSADSEAAALADELDALRGVEELVDAEPGEGEDALVDAEPGEELVDAEPGAREEALVDAESQEEELELESAGLAAVQDLSGKGKGRGKGRGGKEGRRNGAAAAQGHPPDAPGKYRILVDTFATRFLARDSAIVCELDKGQVIDVVEVKSMPHEQRVRARLVNPIPSVAAAWISLLDTAAGTRFAALQTTPQVLRPCVPSVTENGGDVFDVPPELSTHVAKLLEQDKVLSRAALQALATASLSDAKLTLSMLEARDRVADPSHFVVEVLRRRSSLRPVQGVAAPKKPPHALMPRQPKAGATVRPTGPKPVGVAVRDAGLVEDAATGPPLKKARVASAKWAPGQPPMLQPQEPRRPPPGRPQRSWQLEVEASPGRPPSSPASAATSPAALRAAGRRSSLLLDAPDGAPAGARATVARPQLQRAVGSDSDSSACSL